MRELTYREAVREALAEEMRRDPTVVVLGEDVGAMGGNFSTTRGLFDEFGPERVRDTPISEDAIVGLSLGAAITGMRPIAEIMLSSFLGCCMDEIWNQVAQIRYMTGGQCRVPLVIRTTSSLGRSGAAHHSSRPEAWFMHIPGLKVVVPSTPYDAKGLLKTAVRSNDPVMFFEHALLYKQAKGHVPEGDYTVPFGQANVVREGSDVTIVTFSGMLPKAVQAAEKLAAEGVSAEVIDLRTLVPLDEKTILDSVRKTRRLIVAEEDCLTAGVGAEIVALVVEKAFDYLDAPPRRVACLDTPVPFSPPLENYIMPKAEQVVETAFQLVRG